MTATENTAPAARHLEILAAMNSHGEIEASREVPYPTLAAMARRGLVEIRTRRQDMIGTDPRPYKLARITDAGRAALADAEPSAEDVLGACVVDEPGADLPEATDAGFGYGLTPTELPEAAEIVGYLTEAGMSAGIDEHHGVVAYSASPETLACALDGTGWAAVALTLGGMTVPGMYAVERTFALPPAPAPKACRSCGTVTGSGCATCRPDSVLGG